jgi:HEAT repeat protein
MPRHAPAFLFSALLISAAFAGDRPAADSAEIEKLVRSLGAESWEEREKATERLTEIGKPAHEALRRALSSPDAEVRYRARLVLRAVHRRVASLLEEAVARGGRDEESFQTLAAIGQDALDPLAAILRRELLEYRGEEALLKLALAAIEEIGRKGDGDVRGAARAALVGLIDLNLRGLAPQIAASLAALGEAEARAAVAARLSAPEALSRQNAVRLLGEIGGRDSVTALEKPLHDEDPAVRGEAVRALVEAARRDRAARAAAADLVLGALEDPDRVVETRAIQACGEFREKRAAPRLRAIVRAAELPEAAVEGDRLGAAITALGLAGDRESVPAILGFLVSERVELAGRAADALGMLKAREAVPGLLALLEKGQAAPLPKVLRALGRIGDPRAFEPLKAFYARAETYRPLALEAIARLDGKEPVAFLLERANMGEDEGEIRLALAALARRAAALDCKPALGELAVKGLARPPVSLKLQSLRVIAQLKHAPAYEAVARLLQSSSDPRVRKAAIETLGVLGDKRAIEPLRGLLDSADEDSKDALLLALSRLGDRAPLRKRVEDCEAALRAAEAAPADARAIAERRFSLGLAYLYAGENEKGAEQFQAILDATADRQLMRVAAYNVACAKSLSGEKEAAIAALKRSVELGFREWRHMEQDSDLDPIRGEPAVKDLLSDLKRERPFYIDDDEPLLVIPGDDWPDEGPAEEPVEGE